MRLNNYRIYDENKKLVPYFYVIFTLEPENVQVALGMTSLNRNT